MGLISKQIHKRKTTELLAPLRVTIPLEASMVFAIAQRTAEAYVPDTGFMAIATNRSYRFKLNGDDPTKRQIVCIDSVKAYGGAKPYTHWAADLVVESAGSAQLSTVTLQIVTWRIDDGALVHGKAFEAIRERFFAALADEALPSRPNLMPDTF